MLTRHADEVLIRASVLLSCSHLTATIIYTLLKSSHVTILLCVHVKICTRNCVLLESFHMGEYSFAHKGMHSQLYIAGVPTCEGTPLHTKDLQLQLYTAGVFTWAKTPGVFVFKFPV